MKKILYLLAATGIVIAHLKYGTLFVGTTESLMCWLVLLGAKPQEELERMWSLKPEEKSFGVGIHGLASRVFAGIPSLIYFGDLIDNTCLKWGTMYCGEEGACRMYDIVTYRWLYLGLPAVLCGVSYIPSALVLLILKKKLKSESQVLLNAPVEMQETLT